MVQSKGGFRTRGVITVPNKAHLLSFQSTKCINKAGVFCRVYKAVSFEGKERPWRRAAIVLLAVHTAVVFKCFI